MPLLLQNTHQVLNKGPWSRSGSRCNNFLCCHNRDCDWDCIGCIWPRFSSIPRIAMLSQLLPRPLFQTLHTQLSNLQILFKKSNLNAFLYVINLIISLFRSFNYFAYPELCATFLPFVIVFFFFEKFKILLIFGLSQPYQVACFWWKLD